MTKQDLIARWKTKEGEELVKKVISALKKGGALDSISGLRRYAGRWDLRGAQLSQIAGERKIRAQGHSLVQTFGTLKLKNARIESVDFSYADISYSWLEKCKVTNCLFDETRSKELRIIASDFTYCLLRKANLYYSHMNENIGANSGSWKKTEFIETNLSECVFCFPIIEDCIFMHCNLRETNFDGSRIRNCKFKGHLDSLWFRGYSQNAHKSIFGVFNRIDPKNYPNPMKNVDFSEARLTGVAFRNGVDLSKCKFPDSDDYILVRRLKSTYSKAQEIISSQWNGECRRLGLHMIENVYYTQDYYDQPLDLIDKNILLEQFGEEFANKFFRLIRDINPI